MSQLLIYQRVRHCANLFWSDLGCLWKAGGLPARLFWHDGKFEFLPASEHGDR